MVEARISQRLCISIILSPSCLTRRENHANKLFYFLFIQTWLRSEDKSLCCRFLINVTFDFVLYARLRTSVLSRISVIIINIARFLWINLLICSLFCVQMLASIVFLPCLIVSVWMFVLLEELTQCWEEANASLIGKEANLSIFVLSLLFHSFISSVSLKKFSRFIPCLFSTKSMIVCFIMSMRVM